MGEKKVLLVDDDKDLLMGMNLSLRKQGYSVVVAQDSISAVSIARKERPDLIVLDIGLPGGDGFVLIKRFQSLYDLATVPIIVVSARPAVPNRDEALKAGALAFFQKPVDRTQFMAAVRSALGEEDAAAAPNS
jgi:two-component system, cell cycle response regulator